MTTKTEAPKRSGIYARISVHDKKVPKVENQLEQCRDLCERENYAVHDTYAAITWRQALTRIQAQLVRPTYQHQTATSGK